jgi:hypothetical protein
MFSANNIQPIETQYNNDFPLRAPCQIHPNLVQTTQQYLEKLLHIMHFLSPQFS